MTKRYKTRTSDPEYLRRRARLLAQPNLTCWLCGKPIDKSLKHPHKMSFTADHVDPIATGGHNTGPLRPAHLACNSKRQHKSEHQTRSQDTHALPW